MFLSSYHIYTHRYSTELHYAPSLTTGRHPHTYISDIIPDPYPDMSYCSSSDTGRYRTPRLLPVSHKTPDFPTSFQNFRKPEVLKNKNGKAFKNLNDCIQFLSNLQEESHVTRIVNVKTNNSLTEFEPIEINISKIVCNKSKKPKYILSFLYSCLRRTK